MRTGAACAQVGCEHTSLFMRLSNVPIVNVKAQLMLRSCARKALWTLMPLVALVLASTAALAAEAVKLTLKDQRFVPADVSVPAGERFRIEVENQDATPAEFESADLRVEKIVVPGGKIAVMAGPLKPGTYKFFDDYHPDTANGTITAVARKASE